MPPKPDGKRSTFSTVAEFVDDESLPSGCGPQALISVAAKSATSEIGVMYGSTFVIQAMGKCQTYGVKILTQ